LESTEGLGGFATGRVGIDLATLFLSEGIRAQSSQDNYFVPNHGSGNVPPDIEKGIRFVGCLFLGQDFDNGFGHGLDIPCLGISFQVSQGITDCQDIGFPGEWGVATDDFDLNVLIPDPQVI